MHIHDKVAHTLERLNERTHVAHDLAALYTSRTLMRIALGSLGVFVPIFFFTQFGHDMQKVLLVYVAIFGLYALITPLSARLLGTLGTRIMLVLGILVAALSVVALYYFPQNPEYATYAYIIAVAVYYSLYWLPFHVDFAHWLDARARGQQLAMMRNIAGVVLIAVPMIGGFLITAFGFSAVFLFAIGVLMVSIVPLWFMHTTYERFSWSYLGTYKHVFKRSNRPIFLANVANGAQGVALSVLWPIYVFILLDERYAALGVIVSLTMIVVIFLRTAIGRLFDRWSEKRIVLVGVVLATTGWIVKVFVQTPFQIFAADSYHGAGQVAHSLSFDAATYEQAADNGRFVDEYTALKEIALNVGRILMLLLVAVLLVHFDLRFAFIIAAGVSLLMIFLNTKVNVR